MLKTLIGFSAVLTERFEKESTVLPIPQVAEDYLLNKLSAGDHTYLVIRDTIGGEVVKVTNQCGYLTVDRGQDDTQAMVFPRGSCILFEVTPQVVKDLICTYDCCSDGCQQDLVSFSGSALPHGKLGADWEGTFVFTGDTPIHFAVTVPEWLSVNYGANYVVLTGKLPAVGSFPLSIAATNCSGNGVAVGSGTLVVTN